MRQKTIPFGFMYFTDGLGGHCIPSTYCTFLGCKKNGFELGLLRWQTNKMRYPFVVEKIAVIKQCRKKCKRISILVSVSEGRGYLWESAALEIMNILLLKGAKITYTDPYIQ